MSAYQDVSDAVRAMHGALDKVLAQIPKADEFWATRDMIDTEKVCLDSFKAEANQARAKIRKQAQDDKEALAATWRESEAKAKAAHDVAIAGFAAAQAKAKAEVEEGKKELEELRRKILEERAAHAIEVAKTEAAAREFAVQKSAIESMQLSLKALFQKAG